MKYTVAILAMSKKNHGYCVGGIDVENGKWVRLVSNSSGEALYDDDIKYQDGSCCKPLDVVQVPVIGAVPLESQPENVLIDKTGCWEKIKTISLKDVLEIHPLEHHAQLFNSLSHCLHEYQIKKIGYSLILVEVTDLTIGYNKASFTYNNSLYRNISVTDLDYFHVQNGWHTNKAILLMSLPGSPYWRDKCYYKFIAKIFQ